ncbi:NAD-dependent succinate-semialdehyde dehydrogenase [Williamsia phyllosphaerae]|uniref:NAD-dependent succinate-semialdehyde dehydrogenase n=1 Tax=Williamsia phyllosphaerae TaxID=885042 RepID=A0ABQ1U7R3_9NOCA|nr:NAD-dependent succinate-semialdehyde dehydrogenase [Williamsia phyllosphaerae]GGF11219.1 NAD-dependent succinate-semialdehyde dehydrogenase [Williamsia phyllosphaerae]
MTSATVDTRTLVSARADRMNYANDVINSIGLPTSGTSVNDPATGEHIGYIPDVDVAGALEAVGVADNAGRAWARTTPRERANVLHAWYDTLVAHTEEIAHLITREMGKPLAEARGEVKYGSDFVRWYAEEAVRPGGDFREAPDGGANIVVRRGPVGLAVLITPWNFPLAMATRKIAPALAAGCAVVIKPANLTPFTTFYVVELARQAGVPEGLINVITTEKPADFSNAVLRDERVRKVSFTGSTGVGRQLMAIASGGVLRSSMELGGNAPALVFDDADLERAVDGVFAAKLRNGGQSCIAANRIYVQSGIADDFVDALTDRLAAVDVGHGLGDGTALGPMIDRRAATKMAELTRDAIRRGAQLRTGGVEFDSPGNFFAPTLLDHVPASADVAVSEIFGPIAAVQRFDTEDEVIARANDTEFGLAGYVFTENLDRALNVADRLETGLVGINQGVPSNAAAPFGGLKQSGLGREGSAEGLEEYQNVRFYNIARRPSA